MDFTKITTQAVVEGGPVALALVVMGYVFFKVFRMLLKEIVESRKAAAEQNERLHKEHIEARHQTERAIKSLEDVCRDINNAILDRVHNDKRGGDKT